MSPTPARLSLERIEHAARVIDPVFTGTPQFVSDTLSEQLGLRLIVKVETVNPIRSFKGRGADYFVHTLGRDRTPLVCASAGNFGQGLAYAASKAGLRLDVFAATHANPFKLTRMQQLGAQVHRAGRDLDEAKDAARAFATEQGAYFVEDGKEVAISEGAGTIGLELSRFTEPLDMIVIPLGNGALLAGTGTWLNHHDPKIQVIGVCAQGAPVMAQALAGQAADLSTSVDTIADGIAVRVPIPEAVQDLRAVVDEVLLVDDAATLNAMRLVHRALGLVIEPAGAVGVAALLRHPERFQGASVATALCGSNLTDAQRRDWLCTSR